MGFSLIPFASSITLHFLTNKKEVVHGKIYIRIGDSILVNKKLNKWASFGFRHINRSTDFYSQKTYKTFQAAPG